MNPAQLSVLRKGTRLFVKDDESLVEPYQMERMPDDAGGYKEIPTDPRDAVSARIIPLTSEAQEVVTLDGKQVTVTFILMADYDADIRVDDRFTARGRAFRVFHIQERRDYQTKAELITVA